MPVLCVVPARLGSTRLARKPLQPLAGEPLIVRVWQRARALSVADEVVVATDAPEIRAVVERAGGRVAMTSTSHQSGTERVAEVAGRPEFASFDVVLNVQGDEPFLPAEAARGALAEVRSGADVGTAAAPLGQAAVADPGVVKVVIDRAGKALYFSRAPIPFQRDRNGAVPEGIYWQHVGVYAYRREALERWVRWPRPALEAMEQLEQLRALYYGLTIGVTRLARPAEPGIDTPNDLERAESLWPTYATGDS
jgi:3-deoxy-manno-octulosonate cytidylyltransferase (CMP-KDO synthetase)